MSQIDIPLPAFVIADPHYSSDCSFPFWNNLLSLLKKSGIKSLILLGDTFDIWIGINKAMEAHHRIFIDELKILRESGIKILYVPGNRDYFLKNYEKKIFDLVSDEILLNTDSGKILLIHGDRINKSDKKYLFWRAISRGFFTRILCFLLPANVLIKFSHSFEIRLQKTNLDYKASFPEEESLKFTAILSSKGIERSIIGHFHIEKTVKNESVTLYFLPQFSAQGHFAEITKAGTIAIRAIPM